MDFSVRIFDHCWQAAPSNIIEFDNVEEATKLMDSLGKERIPATVHSHGPSGRMLSINHPNPLSFRCDWEQAKKDGWK